MLLGEFYANENKMGENKGEARGERLLCRCWEYTGHGPVRFGQRLNLNLNLKKNGKKWLKTSILRFFSIFLGYLPN